MDLATFNAARVSVSCSPVTRPARAVAYVEAALIELYAPSDNKSALTLAIMNPVSLAHLAKS
jgi:hypothetical protein